MPSESQCGPQRPQCRQTLILLGGQELHCHIYRWGSKGSKGSRTSGSSVVRSGFRWRTFQNLCSVHDISRCWQQMAQSCWEPGERHTRDKGHWSGKTPPYFRLEQWLSKMPLRVRWCAGHLPCTLSTVILSTTLWGLRLKMPALRAQICEGTCPNLYGASSQCEVFLGQTSRSLFPPPGTLGDLGWPARVQPAGSSSWPGAVGTPRTRPWQPGCGPSRGGQRGLWMPRAGAVANIDFGKHYFAQSAGRGRGRPDPGGGGSGSAFRRGH